MTPDLDPDRAAPAAEALSEGRAKIRRRSSDSFVVTSFTRDGMSYQVGPTGCTCPDAAYRGKRCKHELALLLSGEG